MLLKGFPTSRRSPAWRDERLQQNRVQQMLTLANHNISFMLKVNEATNAEPDCQLSATPKVAVEKKDVQVCYKIITIQFITEQNQKKSFKLKANGATHPHR